MKHRLHVVSLPHTQTTASFQACAFTVKVRNFCRMMIERGNEVILYSGEQNDAPCSEHVVCISEEQRLAAIGDKHYTTTSFDERSPHWRNFNAEVVKAIKQRAKERDVLCLIGGTSHKPIAQMLPSLMAVEFGIGYGGTFAKYRVWESYAWMHLCYGHAARNGRPTSVDGVWYDAVIPGYLDPAQFPMGNGKGDYVLFMGRMIDRKGIHVARQACEAAGVKLVTAGPGNAIAGVTHAGEVTNPEERAELMGSALALIAPTIYIEPFGNVVVEAMACGTPAITTDWGAFTETVIRGKTGFRCRLLKEFVDAIGAAGDLNRADIRSYALGRFSLDVVGLQYQEYFDRLATLWGRGWPEGVET